MDWQLVASYFFFYNLSCQLFYRRIYGYFLQCKPENLSRIEHATAAFTKLKPIWRGNNISLIKLMRSLIISIFLYACVSWTLTAKSEKRTQAFEMRFYRTLLTISYKNHVTNEEVRRNIQTAIRDYDELLTLIKKRRLKWFSYVQRSSG